jgi:type II secretory pathway pseudopilin PulG
MKRAFSLLEVLVAGVVLTAALLPIVANLHQLFRGFQRTQEATHATFLAQAVIEGLRHRLYDGDTRFFGGADASDPRPGPLNVDQAELDRRVCQRGYEKFFLSLVEEGAPVVLRHAPGTSRYFLDFQSVEGKLTGLSAETNPRLCRELESYRITVEVRVSVPASALDSDGDGHLEVDMAEVGATVSWTAADGAPQTRTFWTVLTRHQYSPWPGGPRCE